MEYDKYYQTENLFGKAYPELIDFYSKLEKKGSLLDLGCGQGRDAIPLARLGYDVTGLDNSEVGIAQLNKIAKNEKLRLAGSVADIYAYESFNHFDHILLDSMFHFGKKEKEKELAFLSRIFSESRPNALINICIQKVGNKIQVLSALISSRSDLETISQTELVYEFVDQESGHRSKTKYEMIVYRKLEQ